MLRIKAILLLCLFSLSVIGNAFEIHYCKDEVSNISFFGGDACADESETILQEKTCCNHGGCSSNSESTLNESNQDLDQLEKEDCCRSEGIDFLNDLLDKTDRNLNVTVAVALVHFFPHLLFQVQAGQVNVSHYHDPVISRDIPILIQSFLI